MAAIHWAAFVPAAVVVALVPGANQLLSLRNAARQGTADATVALLGRFTAFAVLIVMVAAGLGALLARSVLAFEIVRWAGVAYLGWLGVTTLWASLRRDARDGPEGTENTEEPRPTPSRGRWALSRQEFLVAVTNPKALLLFAAFLPQFVGAGEAVGVPMLVLGAAYVGIEAVSAVAYTVVGGRLRRLAPTARTPRRLDLLTGAAFLGLATTLGMEQRA